jgi:membrane protease YdiL (CAAX protease family)
MRQDKCFTMSEPVCEKTSAMDDGDENGTHISGEVNAPGAPASAPEFAAAVQPSYVWTVFLDGDGLRPGWGLVFYLAMFYLLEHVVFRWAGTLDLGADGLWSMMLEEFGVLLAATVPALVLARVENRPWGAYGLPERWAFGKFFWLGGVWGFASITLLLGTMYGLRVFEVGHLAIHGMRSVKFAAFWAFYFLLVGLFEDFHFRGYLQFTLTRGIGFWPAAVLLSGYFGLSHLSNEGERWTGLLAAAVIGFFFCLTLRRTGSLWFAVGFHAAWDWGETFVYSVPDSGTVFPGHLLKTSFHGPAWLTGGVVGPEGSLLCFLVIGAAWVLFATIYRDVRYGVGEEKSLTQRARGMTG